MFQCVICGDRYTRSQPTCGRAECNAAWDESNERCAQRIGLDEPENTLCGVYLANTLGLKKIRGTIRYQTAWGDKTALGLYLTVKRIIDERLTK